METALQVGREAFHAGEVPIGAILTLPGGEMIARAHNRTEADQDPTAHAEMLCLREAARKLGSWRLDQTTLYVTHEPCPMCAGAILQARIGTLVYGAKQPLLGADGSWMQILPRKDHPSSSNPHPFHTNLIIRHGIQKEACEQMMVDFFRARRTEQDAEKAAQREHEARNVAALVAYVREQEGCPSHPDEEWEWQSNLYPVGRIYATLCHTYAAGRLPRETYRQLARLPGFRFEIS